MALLLAGSIPPTSTKGVVMIALHIFTIVLSLGLVWIMLNRNVDDPLPWGGSKGEFMIIYFYVSIFINALGSALALMN